MKRVWAFVMAACLLLCCGIVGVQAADKVYALTMGVRKYNANNTSTDGSAIAVVRYTRLSDGTSGTVNKLFDIQPGEEFVLTSAPAEGQAAYYAFVGWFDGDGAQISKEETLRIVMDGSKAVFAGYAETADRYVLMYTCVGEGKLSVSSDRFLQQGDGCVSVMSGASATVTITPAKNYSVYFIKVNGEKVTMFANTAQVLSAAAQRRDVKGVFRALVNYVKFLLAKETKYTIATITGDTTFEVGFMKPYFEKGG